jgi:hypothetical protein
MLRTLPSHGDMEWMSACVTFFKLTKLHGSVDSAASGEFMTNIVPASQSYT